MEKDTAASDDTENGADLFFGTGNIALHCKQATTDLKWGGERVLDVFGPAGEQELGDVLQLRAV